MICTAPLWSFAQASQTVPLVVSRRPDAYSEGKYLHVDEQLLREWHIKGIENNHEKVSELSKRIRCETSAGYLAVAGRALARLNAQETVADFDTLIAETKISVVRDWAKVMRARLLAQSAALPNDPAIRFSVFLREIGRTPKQFDTAIRDYNKKTPEEKLETYSMEVTALAELADMIYRGDSEAWLKLPEIKALDVSGVRAAKYRMQFVALPVEKRAAAIVDAIVEWEDSQPRMTSNDTELRFLLQMAIDEGKRGAEAAVTKLKVLNAEREKHAKQQNGATVYPAFGRMLTIVQDTKAKEFLPELEALGLDKIRMVCSEIEGVRIRLAHNGVGTLYFIEGLQAR